MSRRFKRTTYMQWENKKRKHDMPFWIDYYTTAAAFEWRNKEIRQIPIDSHLCAIINRKSRVYFDLNGCMYKY